MSFFNRAFIFVLSRIYRSDVVCAQVEEVVCGIVAAAVRSDGHWEVQNNRYAIGRGACCVVGKRRAPNDVGVANVR